MIEVQFLGAAQTVTGSKHLLRSERASVLLDCGLFQGRRREALTINRGLGVDANAIDAVVLSHAHIDHSGALPLLVKQGFQGPIYATPATRDLCAAMLLDAALIQAADAKYIERSIERGSDMAPVEPLYDEADVTRTLEQFISVPYRRPCSVAPGVRLEFLDAGHVLGSAISVLDVDDVGARNRIVFTGDLGRRGMPILRDPELPVGAQVLISESTYGDRRHPPLEQMEDQLASVIQRAYARGGKIIVPSFALERAQELVHVLKRLQGAGRAPAGLRVYVDSPLTVKLTEVFKLHPECFDRETRDLIRGQESPFEFEGLSYVSDKRDSQALSASSEPAVIISASGMCEAGRVLHHLQACVEDPKNVIVIVGFQAQHTLGRRLVERRARVRIFGVERELRAEVVVLNGFSAHADQGELLDFIEACRERGPLRDVVLVHGEAAAQKLLRAELVARGFPAVHVPARGERPQF